MPPAVPGSIELALLPMTWLPIKVTVLVGRALRMPPPLGDWLAAGPVPPTMVPFCSVNWPWFRMPPPPIGVAVLPVMR
jgi:hypothetical protein